MRFAPMQTNRPPDRSREPPADQMEPRLAGEVAIWNSDDDVEMAVRG